MRQATGNRWVRLLPIAVLPVCVLAAVLLLPRKTAHHLDGAPGALSSIRALQAAQSQFHSQFGRYAASIDELKAAGMPLGLPPASGYRLALTSAANGYVIHAEPLRYGDTGDRSFYADQTMVIRQSRGPQPATANSPEVK